ncbi:MAG: ArnT family glycosyltransferase [Candidatus Acidiferrales bacterium]
MAVSNFWRRWSWRKKCLLWIFLLTLPLSDPWVRGDGIGYYAYARALIVQGNLNFEADWLAGNKTFLMSRTDAPGHLNSEQYTSTGHVDNHFTVGPSILWSPFLLFTHGTVHLWNSAGGRIPADGFSWPYTLTMALATAFYAFLGLLLSFALARKYVSERWAFLATLGIWFASSLPVYMYFNPSWSHALSAFVVALFLWYWDRTRVDRTAIHWFVLGLIGGLMGDVYYPNFIFFLAPAIEIVLHSWRLRSPQHPGEPRSGTLILRGVIFAAAVLLAFLPTLATRQIIYGSPFATGYEVGPWHWGAPRLLGLLFSSDHGLFSWTPILIIAATGLFLLPRRDRQTGGIFLACAIAFYYLIASYPDWEGISSFGNRFFISLTPLFVVGLAMFFSVCESLFHSTRGAFWRACTVTALLIVWNLGFVFQWGTHLISERGPISWQEMTYNQFRVVPFAMWGEVKQYLIHRSAMLRKIEDDDAKKLEKDGSHAE